MKKTFIFALLFAACAALFALDAEVIGLEGKAQYSTNGTVWSPIAVGNKLPQGATIQTGFKSSLKLKVKGSQITLDPMTRIKLDELSEKGDKDNTVVSMKIGGLTSNVKKLEDRRAGFTVKGPAATASVRGTVLREECGYNKDTVTAIENTTLVWPSSSSADADAESDSAASGASAVAAGQVSSVDANGGHKAPQSSAAESAYGLGGAVASAAAAESVSSGGASEGFSSSADSNKGNSQTDIATGSVAISITYMGE